MIGDQGGDRDADDGVDAVPDEIEGGDLVGDELDDEEDGAGDENPGVAEGNQGRAAAVAQWVRARMPRVRTVA